MADPKVTIDALPVQGAVVNTDLLVVQSSGTTKQMQIGLISGAASTALAAHINNTTGAHAATAISAAASAAPMVGVNVQTQLNQAGTALAGQATSIATNTTNITANATNLTNHINKVTGAHSATAVAVSPLVAGGSDVQAALTALAARTVDGDKGDVTVSGSGTAMTIDAAVVTNAKLVVVPTLTFKGRISAGSGAPEDLNATQAKSILALVKADVGLSNVDNTSDANKVTSNITQTQLDTKAPIRRVVVIDTSAAYAVTLSDENRMITLNGPTAITVTLPQNSAAAFTIGAEVDFMWIGAGRPTFVAGTGATVNGTPGLKLRAQYSVATAKKISANVWVVFGDLSA